MTPYEVVINAYNNEVIARNDTMNTVTLRESDVTDLIRESSSFRMCVKATIMRFNVSAPVLDFTAYTRDFVCPHRW